MGRPVEMLAIKVDGLWYRCERYSYQTCSEVLVRGPFLDGVFHSDGRPVWKKGHVTAFKLRGQQPMDVNRNRSKKNADGDPENLNDWWPYWEAYAMAKGLVA
jgi:hypothetical protein